MKGIFAVIILLVCSSLVFGQGLSIGLGGGLNYDMANSGVEGAETSSGLGFGGGLVFDMSILPMLGVEMDIQYAQYKYSSSTGGVDATSTSNNLVIPFLFKCKMAMPAFSPNFVLGPSLIKQLSASWEVGSLSGDVADSLLETDIGIQAGLGANLGVLPGFGIAPYFRFQYNLTANNPDTDNSESAYDFLFGVNFTRSFL